MALLPSVLAVAIASFIDVLKVSVFGEPGGSVATLTIDGYQGDQLEWETPSHATDAPIMVYYDKKAGHTSVWVRDAGTVTVTAFLKATENTPRKELQSFQIEAKAPSYFDLKLKIDGVDYTNKTYEVQGSEGFELVPYVSVEGQEIPEMCIRDRARSKDPYFSLITDQSPFQKSTQS